MSPIDRIAALFAGEGVRKYLGEEVSIATHMLQAGALAEAAGAPAHLVAAALLHDVGHFEAIGQRLTDELQHRLTDGRQLEDRVNDGQQLEHRLADGQQLEQVDHRHEAAGADWLAQWFPVEVTEPVRLHVMAKRYLCAVEPAYFAALSPASVHTLALQGGALAEPAARAFERLPHAQAAVAVRRWDEAAKDPTLAPPPFEHFKPLLQTLLTTASQ